MKTLATITGDNEEAITLSFDPTTGHLYTESFGEPTMEVGPQFASEQQAADYIQDSYTVSVCRICEDGYKAILNGICTALGCKFAEVK